MLPSRSQLIVQLSTESRSLNIKMGYKTDTTKASFVHMLNGTLCATERALCCLVENYQTPEVSSEPLHASYEAVKLTIRQSGLENTRSLETVHARKGIPAIHSGTAQRFNQQEEVDLTAGVVYVSGSLDMYLRGLDRLGTCT